MAVVSMSYLLEAGVHFGHQTKRWNPKMKEYIYNSRDDIYIIDLQKTVEKMEEAYAALTKIVSEGGNVLYVGTKKQASDVCREEATRGGMYYMTERWLGGTLTNFRTIRRRVKRLEEIEAMAKWEGSQLNKAKEILAFEVTKLIHGEEEAMKAQNAARAIFGGGAHSENMPSTELSDGDFTDGEISVLDLLAKTKLVPSKGEARRLIDQGGISIDDEKVNSVTAKISKSSFEKGFVIIKKGKKVYHKAILS